MTTPQEARRLIFETGLRREIVPVSLMQGLGKVLAKPAIAQLSLPPFACSAMDGFAVRYGDTLSASAASPVFLPIAFELAAGVLELPTLLPGQAFRIMTGAPLPPGADAVIKLEDVEEAAGGIQLSRPAVMAENVRDAGEDVQKGATILDAGQVLTAPRMALLAASGHASVEIYRPMKVAVLTTGNELVEPGKELKPGQIYDSNAYAMMAMVMEAGAIPERFGPCSDDPASTRALLDQALQCDVVLTSGGVSLGRYDFVGSAFAERGKVHFTTVAQQPGKPFTFATLDGKPVFGLPGNPVATMVTFEYYVRPLLRQLMGYSEFDRPRFKVSLQEPIKQHPEKQLFLRAIATATSQGPQARLTGPQGSHLITSMARANALLVIPPGSRKLEAGEQVEGILLEPLGQALPASAWDSVHAR